MSSLEAPSAWRPPNSGVPVPVPAPIPVPAPTQVNPAPPAYGGALQPPPYQNPALRPGPPPVPAPRLGQPPFAAPPPSALAPAVPFAPPPVAIQPAAAPPVVFQPPAPPPVAIQPPLATQQVVQPPPLLINLEPSSPNPSAMSSTSNPPQRGTSPADLMSFKRGTRANPLEWTSQFATPVFQVAAPQPQPANGASVPYGGGGPFAPPPPQPPPQPPPPPSSRPSPPPAMPPASPTAASWARNLVGGDQHALRVAIEVAAGLSAVSFLAALLLAAYQPWRWFQRGHARQAGRAEEASRGGRAKRPLTRARGFRKLQEGESAGVDPEEVDQLEMVMDATGESDARAPASPCSGSRVRALTGTRTAGRGARGWPGQGHKERVPRVIEV